jgi:hypothetical protein
MDWFVKAFIRASVTWLALGVTLRASLPLAEANAEAGQLVRSVNA